MQLSGKQIAQIRDALLSAYSRDSLSEMVRVELDETLEAIAGGENLRVVIFKLVTWAEQNGRVDDLIQGAYSETPQNEQIRELTLDAVAWRTARKHAPASSSFASPTLAAPIVQQRFGPSSIDVFVSYSRKDIDAMHCVYDGLRAAGMSVWIDEGEGLKPGTSSWTLAIQEAICEANAFVVLLSPESEASTWVGNEITYAQMQCKRCFPILIAGDEAKVVPIALVNVQWIDGRVDLPIVITEKLVPAITNQAPRIKPDPLAIIPAPAEPPDGEDPSLTASAHSEQSLTATDEQQAPVAQPVADYAVYKYTQPPDQEVIVKPATSKLSGVSWLAVRMEVTSQMTITHKNEKLLFIVVWAALSLLGSALGWILLQAYFDHPDQRPIWVILKIAELNAVVGQAGTISVIGTVIGVMAGTVVGTGQCIMLRRHCYGAASWAVASVVGWAVGWAVGLAMISAVDLQIWSWGSLGGLSWSTRWALTGAVSGAVAGATAGIIQWTALYHHFSAAYWWVVASAVGWAVNWAATWPQFRYRPEVWSVAQVVGATVCCALAWAVTAISMLRLLQHPIVDSRATISPPSKG